MHVSLIVPAPFDTISGGYRYDRPILAELRAVGHEIDVIELNGLFPIADPAARTAGADALQRLESRTIPVIDGLALPAFVGLEDAIGDRRTVGLIHHPLSL